jgi:hypothetical protein
VSPDGRSSLSYALLDSGVAAAWCHGLKLSSMATCKRGSWYAELRMPYVGAQEMARGHVYDNARMIG